MKVNDRGGRMPMRAIGKCVEELRELVNSSDGETRIWAYRNLALLEQGYYSSDELIDLAQETGFVIDDPYSRVRRGTQIGSGVVISAGSAIEGKDIRIGPETLLDRAVLYGNNLTAGSRNRISGTIQPDNLTLGDDNRIDTITGTNGGSVTAGNRNRFKGVNLFVAGSGKITIGDDNELCEGMNLNIPFGKGSMLIGCH